MRSRPYLVVAVVVGVATYVGARPWFARDITRGLVSWDVGVALFVALVLNMMRRSDYERMKAQALAHDEGRHAILVLALAAAGASVAAIIAELSHAKSGGKLYELFTVGLTGATIALSWFFTHLIFALHYAQMFCAAEARDPAELGGLEFPSDERPDYWDFLYFAMVMGATSQTADVNIRSKPIRRVATIHCLVSFPFNTAILATMINLAAGLF